MKLIVAKGYNSMDVFKGWNETEGRKLDGKELATTSGAQMHRSKKLWKEDDKVSKER